jgi:23S rRNA pseudouridine1911/1915/1917 synthase
VIAAVPASAKGLRLDRYLVTAFAGVPEAPSRSEIQRWLDAGAVEVDGIVARARDAARPGAKIVVHPLARARTDAAAEEGIAFDILHVDADLVVVVKPPGLVVHPAAGHAGGTLVNGLLARGLFTAEVLADEADPGHVRPGIVHRLDKGTSGVMVVARTVRAREHLKAQFAKHTIEREYVALASGELADCTFSSLHGRHPGDRKRFTGKVSQGKRAVTHVRVLERLGRVTFVACTLETGRTHQIRMHLGEGGAPIVGDEAYGFRTKDPVLRSIALELGRPALHARVLGFVHPKTGKPVRFEVPPPPDFTKALAKLRAAVKKA